jgi:hypothetical protein
MALHRFLGLKKRRLYRQQQQGPQQDDDDDGGGGDDDQGFRRGQRPEIDTLVILDRAVDLVTPLLTPLTYEGVIDEFIGVHNGAIKVDPALVGDE